MDSRVTEATYSGGVLRPLGELSLHESERVRLISNAALPAGKLGFSR